MSDEEGHMAHSGLELIEVNSEEILAPPEDTEWEMKEEETKGGAGSRAEEA